MKTIQLVVVRVVLISLFCSCSSSPKRSIIGKWKSYEQSDVFCSNIEFLAMEPMLLKHRARVELIPWVATDLE